MHEVAVDIDQAGAVVPALDEEITIAELLKSAGYTTGMIGKWHLSKEPQSLPTAHGFDEYYGIPPDESWDSATYVDTIQLTPYRGSNGGRMRLTKAPCDRGPTLPHWRLPPKVLPFRIWPNSQTHSPFTLACVHHG